MAGYRTVARFCCAWWVTARTGRCTRSKRTRNARLIHQRAGQANEDVLIYRYPVEVDVNVNG